MGTRLVLLLGASVVLVGCQVWDQEPVPGLKISAKAEAEITEKDSQVHTRVLDRDYTDAPVRGKSYRVQVDKDGVYTIDLHSYFFDAYLVLRKAEANYALLGIGLAAPVPAGLLRSHQIRLDGGWPCCSADVQSPAKP